KKQVFRMNNFPIKDSSGNEVLRGIPKLPDILGYIHSGPVFFSFPEKYYLRTVVNYGFKSFLPFKQNLLLFHQGFLAFKRVPQRFFIFYFLSNISDYSLETCYIPVFIT